MSQRQSLDITLQSLAVGAGTAWWLNLETVEGQTDAITFEQAADFIDSLYDLDPCVPVENEAGGEEAEQDSEGNLEPPVEEEEFVSLAQQMMERAALCNLDGSYTCTLRVARSHQDEPYKLVLDTGEVLGTTKKQARASQTIVVEGEAGSTLTLPVMGNLEFEWQGPVYDLAGACPAPAIEVIGSTLNYGKRITGTLTAHFDTQYDLVEIEVAGNQDGEGQECRALAFYHGTVTEHLIEPPEVSEEDEETKRLLCDEAGAGLNPTPDAVSCYDLVDYVIRCQCSDKITQTETERVSVTCPDGLDCPGGSSECQKLISSRTVTRGYTSCPSEENLEGTVSDPDYYFDMCCEGHVKIWGVLPRCATMHTLFDGGKGVSAEDMAQYPGAVFVPVGPEDGVCGEKVTTIQVAARNCCAEAEPLAWDAENSITVVNKSSTGVVFVTGGRILVNRDWTVRGQGIYVDYGRTRKTKTTVGNSLRIFTDDTACGTFTIEVTDGCSTASGVVMCTDGQWVQLCNDPATCEPYGCLGEDGEVSYVPNGDNTAAVFTVISTNGYKRVESVTAELFSPATGACGHPTSEGWEDCVCAHYATYFPGSNWPPCIDDATDWLLGESSTAANPGWCAENDRACAHCDDYGGAIRRLGLYGYDDPYKHEVTAVELWEWVC